MNFFSKIIWYISIVYVFMWIELRAPQNCRNKLFIIIEKRNLNFRI